MSLCARARRRGSRAVATRRSPDESTASAMLRPNPLALPVTNQTLDMRTLLLSLRYTISASGQCCLAQGHIEQRHPILNRLKSETDENQHNPKNAHTFFGHTIGHPFDKGSACADNSRDHADCEAGFQSDCD